jgi:hypothetical protein
MRQTARSSGGAPWRAGLATMCCCTCVSSASHAARHSRGGLLAAAACRDCGVHVLHASWSKAGSRPPSRVCELDVSHPSRRRGAVMSGNGCAAAEGCLCTALAG